MTRTTRFCLTVPLLALAFWAAHKPLHHLYDREKDAFLNHAAQSLITTRFANSPWAGHLLSGFAGTRFYTAANRALPPATPDRVIFFGDSITDFWAGAYPAQFFPGKPYLDRGITGQSSREMAWRFQSDVIDLHPSTVVLLAGTNDVVIPSRHITTAQTIDNLQSMAASAARNHIRVILCSILPVSRPDPYEQAAFTQQILTLNRWLRTYAATHHLTYIDYFAALSTPTNTFNPLYSNDGIHPNAAGYARMQPIAQQALTTPTP